MICFKSEILSKAKEIDLFITYIDSGEFEQNRDKLLNMTGSLIATIVANCGEHEVSISDNIYKKII